MDRQAQEIRNDLERLTREFADYANKKEKQIEILENKKTNTRSTEEINNMKIIDFHRVGNLVRFYLGKDELEDWYGDDWNDTPYEHNAGEVYERFVSGYRDIVFPFNCIVAEPSCDWRNSGNSDWCKDDMRDRKVPCIVVVSKDDYWSSDEFSKYVTDDKAVKFYFGDKMEPSDEVEVYNFGK